MLGKRPHVRNTPVAVLGMGKKKVRNEHEGNGAYKNRIHHVAARCRANNRLDLEVMSKLPCISADGREPDAPLPSCVEHGG